MTTKKSTGRKATPAPKKRAPLEIEGHQLTPDFEKRFLAALEHRRGQRGNHDAPLAWLQHLAVDDVTYDHRPSIQAKSLTLSRAKRLTSTSTALYTISEWPWTSGLLTTEGCRVLLAIIREVEAVAQELRTLHKAIEGQDSSHIQDWLKLDAQLEVSHA